MACHLGALVPGDRPHESRRQILYAGYQGSVERVGVGAGQV
ncbi:hypothetical protein MMEU_1382 [Mycobacterium marinum str. Europe]|nr:hypothetical protein MMEU_1382 [Mycobacterium marinum str. Europe]